MTTDVFYVDFKHKKLISKKRIDDEENFVPDQVNLEKLSYFSELIEDSAVTVKVNTRHEGVDLPMHIKTSSLSTVVTWSHKFGLADFEFDESSVRGTLSFNGNQHYTKVPWESIWGMSTATGAKPKEWRNDIPNEVHLDGPDDDGPKAA